MNTKNRSFVRLISVLALAAGLLSLGPVLGRAALAAPAADVLPVTTCTLVAPAERTCELWARSGTLTLPDATTVPFWGYTDQVTGTAQLPGPALIVEQGDTVHVVLHNELAEDSAMVFPGQGLVPDLVGVAPGGMTTYTFVAAEPGTFLYEAGLLPNGARQVAMGLFGAFVVRPVGHPDWAYGDASTAFNDEALVVLSEVDPALNNDPAGFDMVDFSPQYWLINGAAYPDTAPIATAAGNRVLLRVLNAGIEHRAVGLLGLYQQVVGASGRLLNHGYSVVAETVAPGQSLDTLVSVPGTAAAGTRYPLYETAQHTRNAGQMATPGGLYDFGGIVTFLDVPAGPPGPDLWGPVANPVQVAPNPTAGTLGVTLTATLSEAQTGGANVVAAEYFTDTLGAPGSGVPLGVPAPTTTVSVQVYIPPAVLTGLMPGQYVYYVRGQDALGNWGPVGSAVLTLVTAGPQITGQYLDPNPSNGTVAATIQATGDARPMGPADVVAAEYFIDMMCMPGMGTPMALNQVAPVASLTATIPLATMAGLSEGVHMVSIWAQDSLGNWGECEMMLDLYMDRTGPGASNLVVAPTPNNGYLGILPTIPSVRLEAILLDPPMAGANSVVVRVEGFIDTVGAPDTGFRLLANDGIWDEMSEPGYVYIPLSTIRQLDPGPHTLYVRGKDSSGNWGPPSSVVIIIDKTGPDVTALDIQPNPTRGATGVVLTGAASDPANPGGAVASNIYAAEWFDGTDPGGGRGNPIGAADGLFDSPSEGLYQTISVIGWRPGDHTISVRSQDQAGNWGPVTTYILSVRGGGANAIFQDDFESGTLSAWSQAQGAVSVVPDAAQGGTLLGMAAVVNGETPAYVVDTTPGNEARYLAEFYFHPNGTDTATGQHDILVARDVYGTPVMGVQYEHNAGGGYEVRAWARTGAGMAYTAWIEFDNATHLLQVEWQSGPDGVVGLYVDKSLHQRLTGIDTSDYLVEEVWLGPSGGLLAGMAGTEYFDQFNAIRGIYGAYLPLITR